MASCCWTGCDIPDGRNKSFRTPTPSRQQPPFVDTAHVANELNKLSVQQREEVLDDIHGVGYLEEEKMEFLEKCYEETRDVLKKMSKAKRKAYDRALLLRPSLATDSSILLLFLRATRYNCREAAERICMYFKNKRRLWGEDCLAKTLTLGDLNADDMESMSSGSKQIIGRDQQGRSIMLTNVQYLPFGSLDSYARFAWYLLMTFVEEDECNQLQGTIEIINEHGASAEQRSASYEFIREHGKIFESLPFRYAAIHLCHTNAMLEMVLKSPIGTIGRNNLVRFRTHYGSTLENRYSLLTFGIDASKVFSESTAAGRRAVMEDYITERKSKEVLKIQEEENLAAKLGVSCLYPTTRDVLCGRGSPLHMFAGSLRLHDLVDTRLEEYHSYGYKEKKTFAQSIMRQIQTEGGRFLSCVPDKGWLEVDEKTATQRVINAFRMRDSASSKRHHDENVKTIPDGFDGSASNVEELSKRLRKW